MTLTLPQKNAPTEAGGALDRFIHGLQEKAEFIFVVRE